MLNVPVSFVIGAGTASGEGGVWASATDAPTVVSATAAELPAPAALRKCLRENFTSSPQVSEETDLAASLDQSIGVVNNLQAEIAPKR